MSIDSAETTKTPAEIYTIASRSEQVSESAKLFEYALRIYVGDYSASLTNLYNDNRKIFDKPLRDRIREAFEVRRKLKNVAKHGEPAFEAKTAAAESFIAAAEFFFQRNAKLYSEKFLRAANHVEQDSGFFEQGFEDHQSKSEGRFEAERIAREDRDAQEISDQRGDIDDGRNERRAERVAQLDEQAQSFSPPSYVLPKPSWFGGRVSISNLEKICVRMGRSLKAGIAITKAWENECDSQKGTIRDSFKEVLNDISSGEHFADALSKHACFPPMLAEMVRVGEETGRLDKVFLRLGDHYRNLIQMRRTFIQGITWPVLQLVGAIIVMSLFFVILAVLENMLATFKAPDIFMMGFSPIGNLFVFWMLICGFGVGVFLLIKGIVAGWFGETPMKLALKIPLVGNTIKILCLSRFAWSFGMAVDTGMDATRAIRLGVRSTRNHYYMVHEDSIADVVGQGKEFFVALNQTQAFPDELLQAVQVGELTGELTESLERLSDDYREDAELSLRRISQISGFVIMIGVMLMIGVLIFMMYANYLNTLNEALSDSSGPKSASEYRAMDGNEKTSNPYVAAKNEAVKNFVENNEDFKKMETLYDVLKGASGDPNKFLDSFDRVFEAYGIQEKN